MFQLNFGFCKGDDNFGGRKRKELDDFLKSLGKQMNLVMYRCSLVSIIIIMFLVLLIVMLVFVVAVKIVRLIRDTCAPKFGSIFGKLGYQKHLLRILNDSGWRTQSD